MQELDESRRLYNAQKRALREALAAAAEAEAVERQADEARARTAVAQVRCSSGGINDPLPTFHPCTLGRTYRCSDRDRVLHAQAAPLLTIWYRLAVPLCLPVRTCTPVHCVPVKCC